MIISFSDMRKCLANEDKKLIEIQRTTLFNVPDGDKSTGQSDIASNGGFAKR